MFGEYHFWKTAAEATVGIEGRMLGPSDGKITQVIQRLNDATFANGDLLQKCLKGQTVHCRAAWLPVR